MTTTTKGLPGERTVAGLRCGQVLERLSAYLDRDLDDAERAHLEEHLRGCDACTRMGGDVAGVVRALRVQLGGESLPAGVLQRLTTALDDDG